MQMNGKEGMPTYTGLGDCMKKTFKNSGVSGFYRGISAALTRYCAPPAYHLPLSILSSPSL